MQTFMPLPSFVESAAALDYRRLGKQRVEVKQLLHALGVPVGGPLPPKPSSWRNHPAARMWKGYEFNLVVYGAAMCQEWISRGYCDSLAPQFLEASRLFLGKPVSQPPWMGNPEFHAAHRSNLLRKLPDHYSRFGWTEPHDLPYIWPEANA